MHSKKISNLAFIRSIHKLKTTRLVMFIKNHFTKISRFAIAIAAGVYLTNQSHGKVLSTPKYIPINNKTSQEKPKIKQFKDVGNWQKLSADKLKQFKVKGSQKLEFSNKYIFNDNTDSILWKCDINDSLTIPMDLKKISSLQFFMALLVEDGGFRKFKLEFLDDKESTRFSYNIYSSRRFWNHTQFRASYSYSGALSSTYNLQNKSAENFPKNIKKLRITALNRGKNVYIGCLSIIKNPKLGAGKKSKDFRMDTGSDGSEKKLKIKLPSDKQLPPVTQKDIADINKVEKRLDLLMNANVPTSKANGMTEADFKKINTRYNKLKLTRTPWAMNGVNVTIIPNYSSYQSAENDFAILLKDVAAAYWQSNDETQRKKLEDMFIMMFDYHWYIGGMPDSWSGSGLEYVASLYSMRKILYKYNRLTNAVVRNMAKRLSFNRMYLNYSYYLSHRKTFTRNERGEDIDYTRMRLLDYPMYTLLFKSEKAKVYHLKKFTTWLNNIVFRYSPGASDGFKPDGSGFHHLGFINGYASPAIEISSKILWILSKTKFAVSPYSHNLVRSMGIKHDFYNKYTAHPPTLSGKGFNPKRYGGSGISVHDNLAFIALAGTPTRSAAIDKKALALYLRQCQDLKNITGKKSFKNDRIHTLAEQAANDNNITAAETEQQGHLAMNWGAAAIHRYKNWLAVLKLHSKFQYEAESFNYSTFLGYGTLLLFRDTWKRNGAIKLTYDIGNPGWDWRLMPGTTTVKWDDWAKVKKKDYKRYRAPHTYAGGVEAGSYGVSAIDIYGSKTQGLETFRAKKSYFFLNEKIVCLGTGINNKIKDAQTVTTIFQDTVTTKSQLQIDNKEQKGDMSEKIITKAKKDAVTLLDEQKNGYYIFPKQLLVYKRGKQKSPNADAKSESSGNYAIAYFNHGKSPRNRSYSYIMLPFSSKETLEDFNKKMATKKQPIKVLANNNSVQAVYDTVNNVVALSVWKPSSALNIANVSAISSKCTLLMKKDSANNCYKLAIAYPDLQLKNQNRVGDSDWGYSLPKVITIILKGSYRTNNVPKGVKIVTKGSKTMIKILLQSGITKRVTLLKN